MERMMSDAVSATATAKPHQAASTHQVHAALTFIIPQDEKPYFESSALTGDVPKVFFKTEEKLVTINDMRPLASTLSTDVEGFELVRSPTAVADLYDDAAVDTAYNAEIVELLKRHMGADHAVVFDVTRRSDAGPGAANRDGQRGPATRVHVDYTPKSGPQRAKDCMGEEEVERLLSKGGRLVQINVWRPISGPVRRSPLALADATSVAGEELIATDQRFPNRTGEIYQLAYGENQRWYYAPEMERDEVILIKSWDSLGDEQTTYPAHGAFQYPDQDPTAPPRESIEVRSYVIFEPGNPRAKG
jgi:hypothetical protein